MEPIPQNKFRCEHVENGSSLVVSYEDNYNYKIKYPPLKWI